MEIIKNIIILIILLFNYNLNNNNYKLKTINQENAQFGWETAINKQFAAVTGGHYKFLIENKNYYAGIVLVYKKNTSGKYFLFQEITPPTPKFTQGFGSSLSLVNDFLFISAPLEKLDTNSIGSHDRAGAIFVYKFNKSKNKFIFFKKIIKKDRNYYDMFGKEMDFGNKFGIIANNDKKNGFCILYYSNYDWKIVNYLNLSNNGNDISIYENNLLFSTKYSQSERKINYKHINKVTVAKINELGEITDTKILVPKNIQENMHFGEYGLKIYKNVCLVNSYLTNKNGANRGSVYVFFKNENNDWEQVQRIVSPDINLNDWFGHSIDIFGDYAVIGSMGDNFNDKGKKIRYLGAVYIYKIDYVQKKLIFYKKIPAPNIGINKFGFSVNIFNNSIIIGSRLENYINNKDTLFSVGAAYMYNY